MNTLIDQYEKTVTRELRNVSQRLDELRRASNVEVFVLDEEMLERAAELAGSEVYLTPFDQAILAAVLVRGARLHKSGEVDVFFCEQDKDLQCWDKSGKPKYPLTEWYDEAGVWVYKDFTLTTPMRPHSWAVW